MDQPFESDVMDDLAAETPLSSAHDHYNHYNHYDESEDEYDREDSFSNGLDDYGDSRDRLADLDQSFDAAIHQELSAGTGRNSSSSTSLKALDEAIAAALTAPATDAFLRRLSQSLRAISTEATPAKKNGKRPAQRSQKSTGAIAPVARLAMQLSRAGAEAEEALEAFLDLADAEPDNPAIAPVIGGLSLHSTIANDLKNASQRQRVVHSVGRATQTLAQQQGSQAMAAMPRILEVVQRHARAQQIPPAELPGAIQRIVRQVSTNGELVQRLAQAAPSPTPTPHNPQTMTVAKGTVQRLIFDRPVELTIRYL